VPPEDFAASFQFPLDLIRVTSEPIIDAEEAERVVATSVEEGIRTLTLTLTLALTLTLTLTLTLARRASTRTSTHRASTSSAATG
jgi:hypothetical protein